MPYSCARDGHVLQDAHEKDGALLRECVFCPYVQRTPAVRESPRREPPKREARGRRGRRR